MKQHRDLESHRGLVYYFHTPLRELVVGGGVLSLNCPNTNVITIDRDLEPH